MTLKARVLSVVAAVTLLVTLGATESMARDRDVLRGSIDTPAGSIQIRVGERTVEFGNNAQSVEMRLRALELAVATLFAQQGYQVSQPTTWECTLEPFTETYTGEGPTENAARSAVSKACRAAGKNSMFCEPKDAKCMQLQ